MTEEQTALFALLCAGLWEKEPVDLSVFPLTDAGWRSVYRLAVRQTVTGIVYRGLHYLPDNLLPDEALMITWVAKADQIERRNMRMNAAVDLLFQQMDSRGLHPVLQKGQGVAAFYKYPLLRECGDIDIYFPTKQEMDDASELMRKRGCSVERHADGSNCYSWQGVDIEHHSHLFDICNPFLKGFLSDLVQKHGFTTYIPDGDYSENITVPSPLPNLLMLNAHLLKHVIGHGVGLRQFCDMAMAYHALSGSYSAEELRDVYRRTGLLKWSALLHTFLTEYLGLSHTDLPYTDNSDSTAGKLLQTVMEGGNFGQYADTRGNASQTKWERKMRTFLSFLRNGKFSFAYARREAFWTSVKLIVGNIIK